MSWPSANGNPLKPNHSFDSRILYIYAIDSYTPHGTQTLPDHTSRQWQEAAWKLKRVKRLDQPIKLAWE
jgi:hypothetical protein